MPWSLRSVFILVGCVVATWAFSGRTQAQNQATYAGAEGCLCHADPVQSGWQKSKHARAFQLLKLAGQEKNDKCLPCHTTGYGRGGYGTAGVTVNLEGVQCEECHGPAGDHAGTMDKAKVTRTPSALVCARCHLDRGIHPMK